MVWQCRCAFQLWDVLCAYPVRQIDDQPRSVLGEGGPPRLSCDKERIQRVRCCQGVPSVAKYAQAVDHLVLLRRRHHAGQHGEGSTCQRCSMLETPWPLDVEVAAGVKQRPEEITWLVEL